MLTSLDFHDIISICVSETRSNISCFGDKYTARDITIKDKEGKQFRIRIFSHLDEVEISIPEPKQEVAPDFIGMLDELTIRA
jgi:hypothetical protein